MALLPNDVNPKKRTILTFYYMSRMKWMTRGNERRFEVAVFTSNIVQLTKVNEVTLNTLYVVAHNNKEKNND